MKRELILNGNPMEEIVVGFARAVRVGPYIAGGGTAPVGPDGKTVGIGDAGKQDERCFEIAGDALARAGSGWHDVVRIMQVTRFVHPEWLVEIEVDAVVADAC